MINITIVFDNKKDKELLNFQNLTVPFFVDYIDMNNSKGRKEGFKLLNYWSAKKLPLVILEKDNSKPKIFYSELGNSISQLIKYLNMTQIPVINKGKQSLPVFETSGAAGADIRADFSRILEYPIKVYGGAEVITAGEGHDKVMVKLTPHSRALIPTGLYMAIPEGYELQIRPRSGLALKEGLSLANCTATIDSDYRGEVGIIVLNTSNEDRFIEDGERIAQILLKPVEKFMWKEVKKLPSTERGEGGFGHTNKN